MDAVANPYTPNAGAEPPVIVGRDDQLETFNVLLQRMRRGRTEQSMIITGLRGVGKTVLLGRFRTTAQGLGWVVVDQEVSKHADVDFRRGMAASMRAALLELSPRTRWTDRLRRAGSALRSFSLKVDPEGSLSIGLNVDPLPGVADAGDLSRDLTDLFVAVGEAAQSVDGGVVLLLDELQFLARLQLEALIAALHKTVQRKLPITMVGAGLPQIAELAGDAKSYAERLFKFPAIGNLRPQDARRALIEPARDEGVTFTEEAADHAIELTGGYPYFLQELGYAVWGAASGVSITRSDVDDAVPLYEAKLDTSFFRVRLDRATELQRSYLRAMAELGSEPQKAADVAEVMGRTSTQLGPTRAELINMGLLYTPEHGYAAFTVPHFDRYLRRVIPELIVPPVKRRKSR